MEISSELVQQVFSLPPFERYQLAQQLLDSIEETDATNWDQDFVAELQRRRQEMLRGEELISDWRGALSSIENSLPVEKQF